MIMMIVIHRKVPLKESDIDIVKSTQVASAQIAVMGEIHSRAIRKKLKELVDSMSVCKKSNVLEMIEVCLQYIRCEVNVSDFLSVVVGNLVGHPR